MSPQRAWKWNVVSHISVLTSASLERLEVQSFPQVAVFIVSSELPETFCGKLHIFLKKVTKPSFFGKNIGSGNPEYALLARVLKIVMSQKLPGQIRSLMDSTDFAAYFLSCPYNLRFWRNTLANPCISATTHKVLQL